MSQKSRGVYRPEDMQRLLNPKSVALVGASANPVSLGGRTLANLSEFRGTVFPVNLGHAELLGRKCYPSVEHLPESPDCVVLAIPKEMVATVTAQCVTKGAGAIIVLASGYAEMADDRAQEAWTGMSSGAQAQLDLTRVAALANMRVVGPNCVGVARQATGLRAAFAEFSSSESVPGARVGLVAQSGALGLGLSHAAERGVSVSHVLTCGNSCDVDVADYVAWLAQDDGCDAIALVFEGLADPGRLREAAALARAAGKRIAACKVGMSDPGRSAVRFHTHTDAGEPDFWPEFFLGEGIVRVSRIECLMETAAFLAKAPRPPASGQPGQGRGVAVVSGSGGTAILAVDAASRHGVETPQPGPRTEALLRAAIPAFGSSRNPCDATAQATRNPQSLIDCANAMLADEHYFALVIPWGRSQPGGLLADLAEVARAHGKPMCIVLMSQGLDGPGVRAAEMNPGLVVFRSLDACFDALAQWFAFG